MPPARFISLEGIDGSGKSTQARLLTEAMQAAGRQAMLTREPGGSPGAEEIRHLLVSGEPDRWSPETEMLLFTAARRDHLERTILPALEAGRSVISDRFADSTRVYQGTLRPELRPIVDALHELMIRREPDVTFVIDVDVETAGARHRARRGNETRFESFGADFQAALRDAFLTLARSDPNRLRVIDGNRPPDQISAEIAQIALS